MREPGKSCVVVNAGSYDIFHERIASGSAIESSRELISILKDRFSNIVMIGARPHIYENNLLRSLSLAVNSRVHMLCKKK